MIFSSLTFLLLFLPIVLAAYFIMPNRTLKNLLLFSTSILFYAWGEPIYVVLILFSTLNDYVFSLMVQKEKDNGNDKKAKLYFVTSLVVNIGILSFFKYSGFIINNINSVFNMSLPLHDLPLPIGISFYTFQTMSYSIDVYFGHIKAQRKFLTLATYVALFPQLIAGPIVRYITVEDELENRKESLELAADGARRFIIGLGKKVIIANQMGIIADNIFNSYNAGTGTIVTWFALICYAFQIYYDFSGYSDMAIGLGRIFGFHFLENFNYPYVAKSITDFWRRWHISLSTWFRDYIYIPLGGNRNHPVRNLFIVWLLTGLWHGASWNYIFWGLYYGILLAIEKYLLKDKLDKLPKFLQHFYAIFFILIGWALFRIEDLGQLGQLLKNLFVYQGVSVKTIMFTYQNILYAVPFIILAIIGSVPVLKNISTKINLGKSILLTTVNDLYIMIVLLASLILLVGETFNPFIYFKF